MKHIKTPITYHLISGAHDRIDDQDHVPIADCWIPGTAREIVLAVNAHDALFGLCELVVETLESDRHTPHELLYNLAVSISILVKGSTSE